MWRVNIQCNAEAWKQFGANFKALTENYSAELIASKKMSDGTRLMAYKFENIDEVETFQEDCCQFLGFTTDFESF